MSEPINEQVLDFQEPVKTITATEALKSKSNFEQYIYENQTDTLLSQTHPVLAQAFCAAGH